MTLIIMILGIIALLLTSGLFMFLEVLPTRLTLILTGIDAILITILVILSIRFSV